MKKFFSTMLYNLTFKQLLHFFELKRVDILNKISVREGGRHIVPLKIMLCRQFLPCFKIPPQTYISIGKLYAKVEHSSLKNVAIQFGPSSLNMRFCSEIFRGLKKISPWCIRIFVDLNFYHK